VKAVRRGPLSFFFAQSSCEVRKIARRPFALNLFDPLDHFTGVFQHEVKDHRLALIENQLDVIQICLP
jgi:hypothetical protein